MQIEIERLGERVLEGVLFSAIQYALASCSNRTYLMHELEESVNESAYERFKESPDREISHVVNDLDPFEMKLRSRSFRKETIGAVST